MWASRIYQERLLPEGDDDTEGLMSAYTWDYLQLGKVDINIGLILLHFRRDVFNFSSTLAVPSLLCSLPECLLALDLTK